MGKFSQLFLKESVSTLNEEERAGLIHTERGSGGHEAQVHRTGRNGLLDVVGHKKYKVTVHKDGYQQGKHDFHTDSKEEAIQHAKNHIASTQ